MNYFLSPMFVLPFLAGVAVGLLIAAWILWGGLR